MQIRHPPLKPRAGMLLIELIVAASLLAVVMIVAVPLTSRLTTVRENLSDRSLALRELQNLIERNAAENSDDWRLSGRFQQQLDSPELIVERVLLAEEQMEQLNLGLSWIDNAGRRVRPVSLAVFRPLPEAAP